jgi:hypothetical protein
MAIRYIAKKGLLAEGFPRGDLADLHIRPLNDILTALLHLIRKI